MSSTIGSKEESPAADSSQIFEGSRSESSSKFTPDGQVRPFPGATVICHFPENGSQAILQRAIVQNCFDKDVVRNEILKKYYVQLPIPSLHMTLLDVLVYNRNGIAENSRELIELIEPRKADMDRFQKIFTSLRSEIQKNLPVKMKIELDRGRLPKMWKTACVPVKPLDDTEANKLHAIRNLLGPAFDMPATRVRSDYGFHITIYYPLRSLSDEQMAIVQADWWDAINRVADAAPTFEIDRVELCSFENMFHLDVKDFVGL